VAGGLQDALTDAYNARLAGLRARGLSGDNDGGGSSGDGSDPGLRALLLELRNLERAPEGAPAPPDVATLAARGADAFADAGAAVGALGAAAKAAALALLAASRRL
jgi:hypothetical protein